MMELQFDRYREVAGINRYGESPDTEATGAREVEDLVEQLRGRRFAFGSVSSTQGHLIPRIVMLEHGIRLADLGSAE